MKILKALFFWSCACLTFPMHSQRYVVTVPKAGTNLIAKALRLLTEKEVKRYDSKRAHAGFLPQQNDIFYFSHLTYSSKTQRRFKINGYSCILMVRDPRDQVVSHAHWIVEHPELYPVEAALYKQNPLYMHELISHRIEQVASLYNLYTPWMSDKNFCTIKFENLVGDQGGGSNDVQRHELEKIVKHFHLNIDQKSLEKCQRDLFGGTMTFRQGLIGGWKKIFTREQKASFKKIAGKLLISLGYEKDYSW